MKKVVLGAAIAALLTSAAAFAAEDNLPKVLEAPVKQAGMKVANKFNAGGGLTGWVLQQGSQNSVVYTTADGKFLLAGALVNVAGENLTAQYAEKYIPKPEYDKFMPQLEKSAYVVTGAKGNAAKSTIYAFLDPNCMFCHYAYKALKHYEATGLQVRWIPVAFLRPDSAGKAAALLESPNGEAALAEHEKGFNPQGESGGIKPLERISPETAKKLEANSKLMQALGFTGTPGIVYKDKNGKTMTKNGMPRMSELPLITGLPEVKLTDDELAKDELLRFK